MGGFLVQSVRVPKCRRDVMRAVNFVVVACVLSSIFIGLALASAVATAAVHAQLSSKTKIMAF